MPIMAPLASFADVPPQLVVTAYQSANGLVNLVTPTSAVVMGGLAIARVGYGTWLRFVWPVLILLAILTDRRPDGRRAPAVIVAHDVDARDRRRHAPHDAGRNDPMTDSRRTAATADGGLARPDRRRPPCEGQGVDARAGPDRGRGRERAAPSTARTSSPRRPKEPRWQAFLRQYKDPMQIVLLAAGILSLFLPGQFATGVVLIGLTLLNAAMGLNQEGKAEASVAALQKMMVVKAKVRRDGALVQVPMEELVPGDIVNIEAGDLVPADGRILTRGDARDRRVRPDRRERARCPSRSSRSRPTPRSATGSTWRS